MKTLKLPKGHHTIFDEVMIDHLCQDEIFRESVEETEGKIVRMYPDWPTGNLVYELLNGRTVYSDLIKIINGLKKMNYMKEFEH